MLPLFKKYRRLLLAILTTFIASAVYFAIPGKEFPDAPIVAFVVTIMAGFWVF